MASSKYVKMDPREHVLKRPGVYIGSVEPDETVTWVCDEVHSKTPVFQYRSVNYVPGLYKIFDEIVVNVLDHCVRIVSEGEAPIRDVSVDLNQEEGFVEIRNGGPGIDVLMHEEHHMYVPELIFGNLLTSTNYDDKEERTIGGQNGIGAKACNIFSTRFEVETVDKTRGLQYSQVFYDNMTRRDDPKITKSRKAPYTRIRFYPDLKRFGMKKLDKDVMSLMARRVYDMCALTPSVTKIHLNGEHLVCKTFERYADHYLGSDRTERPRVHTTSEDGCWEVVVAESQEGFRHMSFVNGVWTAKGGKHVEYVVSQLTKKLVELIKKRRKIDVRPAQIRECLFLFVRAIVPNPTFDSQTKDTLTTPYTRFKSKLELDSKLIDKVAKLGIVDRVVQITSAVEDKASKKTDGKKRNTIRGIPKLDDANFAGTAKSAKCTLILTEGDSAKTMAISGLSEVGRDYYGVFPLKGKVMNVKDTTTKRINDNDEINHLKKILGLESNKSYDDVSSLRYGRLMIMTDADADGSHIKGLMFNLFHTMWPSLLRNDAFMCSMLTPIVKVTKGKTSQAFYNLAAYEAWMEAHQEGRGWDIKYYKGLGTSTTKEAKEYFKNMRLMRYVSTGDDSEESLDMAFNKKRADDRKHWLGRYDRERQLEASENGSETKVDYRDFVDRELIHFSNYNLERSIPSVCDGLKRSLRKILYCSIKRNLYKEIKVAQLAGYVSEHGAYHHGEASLHDAIVGMAQTFVGSNNLNLLEPNGQFGSRIQGGKDAASPRYIHTQLNPVVSLLFPKDDNEVLEHMQDDGQQVEPLHYIPILPMVLINGALGIGTGFSTSVPCYEPKAVLRAIRAMLKGDEPEELTPWYNGYKGEIREGVSYGCFHRVGDTKLEVTELPVGYWTEDFKTRAEEIMDRHGPSEIRDVESHYTEKEVRFVIHFASKAVAQAWTAPSEEGGTRFETEFKMKTTRGLSTTNMHLYNAHGVIQKYDTVRDILNDFYEARLSCYVRRKAAQLARLREECVVLQAKIRFIMAIIEGELAVMNVPRQTLLDKLAEDEYPQVDKSYDYLVKMPIHALTLERKEDLMHECETKEKQIEDLENTTEKQMWEKELKAIESKL